jgi:tetratricopeptide (TPR) repeat protein
MKMTRALSISLVLVLIWLGAAFGQAPMTPEAAHALQRAHETAQQALATYSSHNIDRPLWQEAIRYGLEAQERSPNSSEPYRFLAETYTRVRLLEQAWRAYDQYEAVGGTLDAAAQQTIIRIGIELAYARYSSRQYNEAIPYYEKVIRFDPSNEVARSHLAQSHLALGNTEAARGYLEALALDFPDNTEYRRLLSQSEATTTFGEAASDAFDQGISLYYSNQLDQAWLAFARAARENPTYQEAFVWAGRVALELRQPADAIPYWERASQLSPDDDTAAYFLRVARQQSNWGIDAFNVFETGVRHYDEGNLSAARASFEEAVQLNPEYSEAWAWIGRTYFETENFQSAFDAYERAVELEAANQTYRYFYAESARLAGTTIAIQPLPAPVPDVVSQPAPAQPDMSQPEPAQPEPAAPSEPVVQPPPTPTPAPEPQVEPEPEPEPRVVVPPPAPAPTPAATGGEPIILVNTSRTYTPESVATGGAISFLSSSTNLVKDLRNPVNYAGGTLHQRVSVTTKASSEPMQVQVCLVPNDDISVKPTCSSGSQLRFDSPGTFQAQQALSSFSFYEGINWQRGISNLMLLLTDTNGNPIDPVYSQISHSELNNFYPLEIHYTAILVPAGGQFPGWP